MKLSSLSVCALIGVLGAGTAFAGDFQALPDDQPTTVGGVDVACTGVGDEAKSDPRWKDYSVRLEFAGGEQQYLADLDVSIADSKGEELAAVRCGGPWLLVNLGPGKYRVRATFEHRLSKTAMFSAPAHGQKRVVIAFPEVGGGQ